MLHLCDKQRSAITWPYPHRMPFHVDTNLAEYLMQVYRMAADDIGCSLAEAAEAKPYEAYLSQAQATPRSLHVVSCRLAENVVSTDQDDVYQTVHHVARC